MAKFEAEISANVDGFIKDLNTASKKADEFGKKTTNALGSTSSGFNKLSNSTGQANATAMEFNRIIQDAPYGMIGIGNNIQQLTANFGQLKNATGSTGAAFKATISSLLSSGNLLALGVAAITSAWTFYTMWSQKANKATQDNTDKFDELYKSLSQTSQIMVDAAKNTGKEVAELRTLYNLSNDATKSTNDRKDAASKLIQQYPELFGKFSTEQVMLGQAKIAYNQLSTSILATARAQAAYGKIGEKAGQQIALDETNNSIREQIALLDIAIKRQESITTMGTATTATGEAVESGNISKLNSLREKRNKLQTEETSNLLERAKLQEQINKLDSVATVNQTALANGYGLKIGKEKESTAATKDYARELTEALASMGYYDASLAAIGYKYADLSKLAKEAGASAIELGRIAREELGEKLSLALGQYDLKDSIPAITLSGINIDKDAILAQMKADLESIKAPLSEITQDVFSIDIGGALAELGASAMQGLGDALANGASIVNTIGNALLSTLGGLAVSVGKQMMAFGAAALGLQQLIKNPYLAIAAGAALIALGSIASSSVSNTISNASGGGYASSSVSSTADYSQFRGALYNNDKQTVELLLKNGELRGAIQYGNNRNNRLA